MRLPLISKGTKAKKLSLQNKTIAAKESRLSHHQQKGMGENETKFSSLGRVPSEHFFNLSN